MIISIVSFCTATSCAFADDFAGQFFIENASTSQIQAAAKPARNAAAHVGSSKNDGTTMASWYGGGEKLARHTANGEVFRPNGLTAAHRSLPLGTRLIVSANGHSITVRVNDRGPAKWTGRSLDLSRGAAIALGMMGKGTARVSYRVASL